MPTVAFHTLGCKVNQGETAAMAHLFQEAGYEVVDFSAAADVYVINSCAVTVQAEKKSRQIAHRAREQNRQAMIVMVGCYPQVAQGREQLPEGVDLLVGSADKPRIVELVERARETSSPLIAVSRWTDEASFQIISTRQQVGRTRATLKVQDGCQQFCSYCIIPYARGPERSRPIPEVVEEARALVEDGFKEVVITGIHVGSYGHDLPGQPDLVQLIEQVLQVPGLERLRLSSIEPNEIGEPLMQLMRQYPNFCRHLHIPLQAGQDRILKAMNRRYNTAEYRAIIDMVRSFVPEIAITTDVIVGFPSETAAEFQQTYDFIAHIGFSRLHVFRYSRRPGTPAAEMPQQVPKAEKIRRSRALIALGRRMAREYAQRLIGTEQAVLWESWDEEGVWSGHTDTYVTVCSRDSRLRSNQITKVLIDGANAWIKV
ncbi:MAG: tRNA (N(6)-L-threonylcarbamoyladenosine(37)-C(2))-methylthiotransferase MtaB [Firmicutes bacterium]|nr:tRNA (N(6)-L-threonylcarbamoyladenosine(37)-C(2))-methylthiotransferase MtaB [Bacillota bacterium]